MQRTAADVAGQAFFSAVRRTSAAVRGRASNPVDAEIEGALGDAGSPP
jgi:hypothetical protein